MYNRYIRNDNGVYTRIPQEESKQQAAPPKKEATQNNQSNSPHPTSPPSPPNNNGSGRWSDGLTGFLRHFLDQLHLDHVDTGDLLLLVLLFFLFREDADEELLVALGLLLIL